MPDTNPDQPQPQLYSVNCRWVDHLGATHTEAIPIHAGSKIAAEGFAASLLKKHNWRGCTIDYCQA